MSRKNESAKARIRAFLLENVGTVVTSREISDVSKIIAHARRVRELRDEEGMQILTHHDRSDLKPGEYVLVSADRVAAEARGAISKGLWTEVMERDGNTCQSCGRGPGDPDPTRPNRSIRLSLDHILPVSQGGKTEADNLCVKCNICNEGTQNVQPPSETARNIIARLRKLPRAKRREIYELLKRGFKEG